MQADSCLHSEQIDTLFSNVGGQEGGSGGRFGPVAQNLHQVSGIACLRPPVVCMNLNSC